MTETFGSSQEKWVHLGCLLSGILRPELLADRLSLKLVDLEVILPFGDKETGPAIWLIVETEAERSRAVTNEGAQAEAREFLRHGGYPSDGSSQAEVRIASMEQIDAAGGMHVFFR